VPAREAPWELGHQLVRNFFERSSPIHPVVTLLDVLHGQRRSLRLNATSEMGAKRFFMKLRLVVMRPVNWWKSL
jgi:hypothetical protein